MLKLKLQYFDTWSVKSWLTWKDPDAGKHWGQEEKGMTEDEMVGWHQQHNGHAAAAKSLQSCLTLCDPINFGSPPGSPVPGILQQEYWSGLPLPSPNWTWVWVNSRSWWWTRRPGVLQSMGSPRVGHDWENELNWTEPIRSEWLPWWLRW